MKPKSIAIVGAAETTRLDRKSTRLNSSHVSTSYAVICLKKKNAHGLRLCAMTASGPPYLREGHGTPDAHVESALGLARGAASAPQATLAPEARTTAGRTP